MDYRQNLDLLREFPVLIPQNKECTTFDGFISAGGQEFRIYIDLPNSPSVKGVILFCQLHLRSFLDSCKNNLKEWESSGVSLFEFLVRLQNLIAVGIQHGKLSKSINTSCMDNLIGTIELYSWLIEEVQSSGWEGQISLEGTFGEMNEVQLCLNKEDSSCRNHTALVKFDPETLDRTVLADFPSQIELTVCKGMTIAQIYATYVETIESLQDFWNLMDCIDQGSWVIDPEQPKRKDTYRRIVIGTNVSVYINIDPLDLHKRPDITFIGSERTIMPFRNSLEENLEHWDGLGANIVEKLANALGLDEFPQKPAFEGGNDRGVEQGECSICLCLRMDDGQLPSEVCNNALCALPFHATCLFMVFCYHSFAGNAKLFCIMK